MNKIVSLALLIGSAIFYESHTRWGSWKVQKTNTDMYNAKHYFFVKEDGHLYESYLSGEGNHGGMWMTRRVYSPTREQIQSLSQADRNRLEGAQPTTYQAPKKRIKTENGKTYVLENIGGEYEGGEWAWKEVKSPASSKKPRSNKTSTRK